jgi:cysteine desulfuration protein SufE
MTTKEIQDSIIDKYGKLDAMDLYDALIQLGKEHKPLSSEYRTEDSKVAGCQNNVWIVGEIQQKDLLVGQVQDNPIWTFKYDSDSAIVRGVLKLMFDVLNERTTREINDLDLYFLVELGLDSLTGVGRTDGFRLIKQKIATIVN